MLTAPALLGVYVREEDITARFAQDAENIE